jgi:hypothetical protein
MDIILSFFIYLFSHIFIYRISKIDINLFLLIFFPLIFFLDIFIFFKLEILIAMIFLILSNIIFFKGVKNFGPSLLIVHYIFLNKPKKIPFIFKDETPLRKRLLINIRNNFIVKKDNYYILTKKSKLICKLYFNIITLFNLN